MLKENNPIDETPIIKTSINEAEIDENQGRGKGEIVDSSKDEKLLITLSNKFGLAIGFLILNILGFCPEVFANLAGGNGNLEKKIQQLQINPRGVLKILDGLNLSTEFEAYCQKIGKQLITGGTIRQRAEIATMDIPGATLSAGLTAEAAYQASNDGNEPQIDHNSARIFATMSVTTREARQLLGCQIAGFGRVGVGVEFNRHIENEWRGALFGEGEVSARPLGKEVELFMAACLRASLEEPGYLSEGTIEGGVGVGMYTGHDIITKFRASLHAGIQNYADYKKSTYEEIVYLDMLRFRAQITADIGPGSISLYASYSPQATIWERRGNDRNNLKTRGTRNETWKFGLNGRVDY